MSKEMQAEMEATPRLMFIRQDEVLQRTKLSREILAMARGIAQQPRFDNRVVVYASMFEDSLAPTWTPGDLFQPAYGARLVAP